MDIYKNWQKLNQEKFTSSHIKKEEIMIAIMKESSSVIHELKKRLKYKMNWILFFLVLFAAWLFFSLSYTSVLPFIGIAIVSYLAGYYLLWTQYRKMNDYIDPNEDTLSTMKKNLQLIRKALQYENWFGMFAFPVAIIIGIMIPRLYEGLTIFEILADTTRVIYMLALLVFLVPGMHYLSNKMNDNAYGNYMRKLEENIRNMEMME